MANTRRLEQTPMADQPRAGHDGNPAASKTTMIKWLGFFLLVFALAGFAFHMAGDSWEVTGSIGGR